VKEFRICWVSLVTGRQGAGGWIFSSLAAALEAARMANQQFPDVRHTVESR